MKTEREIVADGLAQGLSPDQIADQIAHQRVLQDVQRYIRGIEATTTPRPQPEARYRFLPAPPPPTPQEIATGNRKGVEVVTVTASEFPKWCEDRGLDQEAMLAVWEGLEYEHQLWRQHRPGLYSYAQKQHEKEVWEVNKALQDQAAKEAKNWLKAKEKKMRNETPPYQVTVGEPEPDTKSNVKVIRVG